MEPVPQVTISPEWIVGAAAFLISLFFSYFPKLSVKYAELSDEIKQGIMIGLMVLIVAVVFGLGCWEVIQVSGLVCSTVSIPQIVWNLLIAIVVNQSTHRISPQLKSVRAASAPDYVVYHPEDTP